MIEAKVVSVTYSESVGGIPKLDLETHLEDPVVPELFCGADFWDGLDVVIMTKKEYCGSVADFVCKRASLIDENEKLKRENNERGEKIFKLMLNNDAEQDRLREEIQKLREENKSMDSSSNVLRQSLLEEREKTRQLKEEVEKLKDKNTDIQYERTITKMTNSRLSEIVKEYKETIQKLREENTSIKDEIKDLKEKLAQDAVNLDIHPDGTMVFKSKRVSELEKEVKKLKEENEALKNKDNELEFKITDEFTLNITGGLFYKED